MTAERNKFQNKYNSLNSGLIGTYFMCIGVTLLIALILMFIISYASPNWSANIIKNTTKLFTSFEQQITGVDNELKNLDTKKKELETRKKELEAEKQKKEEAEKQKKEQEKKEKGT
jgi:Skp family chaperone for outer membrane proteins